jgi:beta-1,4-mannosyl-glycoprotein beta-1,4-N-acetylglucosaminyltransferase
MIYDCFIFYNELELLELRLRELADVVDKFVLVEATRTFTNHAKPLWFHENRARFDEFTDKIVHIVVRDSPDVSDPWIVERFQRNCIARGLTGCAPNDWVLVSDVDEIPRAQVVRTIASETPPGDRFLIEAVHSALNSKPIQALLQRKGFRRLWRRYHPFVWRFEQSEYRYFVNRRSLAPWYGTRMTRFRDFATAEEMRHSGRKTIPDAGWHFSWMGGTEQIREKLGAFAHQELNTPRFSNPQYIERTINAGQPLFDQSEQFAFVALDDSFPRYWREHPEKIAHWLKPV